MLRSGLWPVPIERHAKRPIGSAWGAECPTRAKLLSLFERHPGAGVGIALGPAPGVVDFEIDNPATAADGTRNTTLNRAAFCLGGLIAVGLLPRQAVETRLFVAAASRGLPEREIRSPLKSGLEAGIRKPRKV